MYSAERLNLLRYTISPLIFKLVRQSKKLRALEHITTVKAISSCYHESCETVHFWHLRGSAGSAEPHVDPCSESIWAEIWYFIIDGVANDRSDHLEKCHGVEALLSPSTLSLSTRADIQEHTSAHV